MSATAAAHAAKPADQSTGITVVPITKHIGADIIGIDLTQPISDAQFAQIHDAWMQHLVLRFRGQNMTKEQLQGFSRRFGELDKAPINTSGKPWVEGFPDMTVMSNIKVDGRAIGGLGYGEAVWHTDMSYNDITPSGALLYGVEVTKSGGETGFLNMYHAYETLPADLKAAIEGKTIKHDASRNSAGDLRAGFKAVTDPREAPGAVHPVVVRHPVTGRKALFLGRRPFGYVMGMSLEDSEALLNRLWAHASQEDLAWFQKWKVGDLLIWDNRCVMHKRTAFDENERRLLYRTQIKGVRPQAA
ncbi:MAG: TauD/TfdA family dioxygenase [Burkholderiales bacterium]|jgi:taurine dioxygenase|nr:TauD/TfdA family dioxygenase [Burkholderiales bacterium]